jgi:hypothetical protein
MTTHTAHSHSQDWRPGPRPHPGGYRGQPLSLARTRPSLRSRLLPAIIAGGLIAFCLVAWAVVAAGLMLLFGV